MKTAKQNPEEEAKKKAARLKKANAIRDFAKELYQQRYVQLLLGAPKLNSREEFIEQAMAAADRSIEDSEVFFTQWAKKRGKYLAPE